MPQHETSTGAANEADRSAFGLVVAGLATGQILAWAVLYYGFASFVLPMMGDLGWAKATLMGAFTLALLVWSLVNYAVGAAIDRGHGRAVLTGGALLGALGCAGWAMAQAPWMLYAAMILVGTAAAMTLYDPAFAVLAKRYPTRYREAITWLTLVAGFASTLSFPAAAALIHGLGWRAALLVLAGVLGLVVAPLHAWLLRDGAATPPPRLGCQAGGLSLHAALRTPAFRRLGVAFTVLAFIGPGLWAHMLPVLQAKGLSDAQAVSVLVWIGPAQVLGRFAYAWLGRGLSLQRLGMMVTVAMPLALLLLAIGGSMASLLLFAAVFGLANGLSTIVRGSLVPACFGHANVGRIGGVMATLSLSAQAAAPLAIAGLLLALGGYVPVLLLLAALGTVGAIAFSRLDPPGRRSS
ncbi:MAG TPA: MFS transporter [Rubrivivax sp.]|nr:MFS transporter [Rubrivivax sp.]